VGDTVIGFDTPTGAEVVALFHSYVTAPEAVNCELDPEQINSGDDDATTTGSELTTTSIVVVLAQAPDTGVKR
jgi:hypothetical protein